ncbi:mCG1033894 [Mus musculus]|nr:mCG1033894 [Mus musculus]
MIWAAEHRKQKEPRGNWGSFHTTQELREAWESETPSPSIAESLCALQCVQMWPLSDGCGEPVSMQNTNQERRRKDMHCG